MVVVRSGRYAALSETMDLAVRLERTPSAAIILSGDVRRQGSYLASFVSMNASESSSTGTIEANVQFRGNSDLDTGALRLDIDERGFGSYQLTVDLQNGHKDFLAGELRWESSRYRKLRIEIDGLEGTLPPQHFASRSGLNVNIKSAYESVGFDVTIEEDPFTWKGSIQNQQRGWTTAEMHMAMEATRRPPSPNEFQVHVFVAGFMEGRDNRGVLGIMFDWGTSDLNGRPREGVTIFHDHPLLSDPRVPIATRNREYIFTAVHEIGHAMNLLHSFDKSRPASLSWMNYPQYFPFGHEAPSGHDGSDEFWGAFAHGFDNEELQHLRHATPREILPGGFGFGVYEEGLSVPLGGTVNPRRPAPGSNPLRANRNLIIQLLPHRSAYELGEPVLVSISLKNKGSTTAYIPNALDPTEGYVRIEIRAPNGRLSAYRPPMRLCKSAAYVPVYAGANLNGPSSSPLFLGADGPTFTEVGTYRLRAILSGVNGRDVVIGDETAFTIERPTSAIERFAIDTWNNRRALEALYLRHPLVARDDWHNFEDAIAKYGIDKRKDNSTASYMNYVGGVGWMTPILDFGRKREMREDLTQAAERMRKVNPKLLPESAARRVNEFAQLKDDRKATPVPGRTYTGIFPLRPAETVRASIPPAGIFGFIGLDRPKSTPSTSTDPTKRVVDSLRGKARFADIVSWNIEHLHSKKNWPKIDNIAELIRSMRCDFWGVQEVDRAALRALVDVINSNGTIRYELDVVDANGQQCGCLYRTDTVRVHRLPLPDNYFNEEIEVKLSNDSTVTRRVFFREPYLADVRVRHGDKLAYDFRCAVVHLKSTDTKLKDKGASIRARSAELLAAWIRRERENSAERDYIALGDMNAETAGQGLGGFSGDPTLALLSVGMQEKYGSQNALTRVASKRLLDHVVVTADSQALMPDEDVREQIVIRSDRGIASFTSDYSDHIPVAVRFVIGEDTD